LSKVVTKSQKMAVMEGCHSDVLGGGHFGQTKTFVKITEMYYWVRIMEDVRDYCKSCDKCHRADR